MAGYQELRELAELNRKAKEIADLGGERPKREPLTIGAVTAAAVFILLDLFSALMLPDRNTAFWPVVIITIACSSGAAMIQWWRERAWLKRHSRAFRELQAIEQRPNRAEA